MKLTIRLFIILLSITFFASCNKSDSLSLDYEHRYNIGIELAKEGKFEEARAEFTVALEMAPGYSPAEGCLVIIKDVIDEKITGQVATTLFRAIDYGNNYHNQLKIRELNLAISLNPEYAPAYNERGIAFFEMEKYQQSLADRNRAIVLDPAQPAPYFNKALTCEKLGLWREAIGAYRMFVERATENQKTHSDYARFRARQIEEMLSKERANV